MTKLSRDQLDQLAFQLQQTKPHQALQAELLDHVASLIEQRMDQGEDFPMASSRVMQQANPQAMDQLKRLYRQEFDVPIRSIRRLRSRRRPATKPFQYMLLSSVLTFLILMGFLLIVCRPLAVSMAAFRTTWGAGLAGLTGVLLIRWWLSSRLRKPKPFIIA